MSSAAARKGFQNRLTTAPTLTTLLSTINGLPAIVQGWPWDVLLGPDPKYFPRLTWFTPVDNPLADTVATVEFQIDLWVWKDGTTGGYGRLEAIDAAFMTLLENRAWTQDGRRLHSSVGVARDFPRGAVDDALRRMRMVNIIIS